MNWIKNILSRIRKRQEVPIADHQTAECHRYPPVVGSMVPIWPAVKGNDYCGEYRAYFVDYPEQRHK